MSNLPEKKRARRGRGEGSLYQRGDGLWVGAVSLGIHGGKRSRRVVLAKTKQAAQAKLQALQARSGQAPDAHTMTLETWLARWLELIENAVEPGTLGPYQRHVNKHIVPRIGGTKLQRLRPTDIEALYAKLLKGGISAALTRKVGTTLSVAMNHAVRSQLIPSNPCLGVRRPVAEKPDIVILTRPQSIAFCKACRRERLGPLFLLILDAGCRPGEALALTWQDIDGRFVSFTKTLEDTGRVKKPKTPRSIRQVELTPATVAALHRHRKAMLAEGHNARANGLCFVDEAGERILPNDLTRGHLRPMLERHGLPPISAYSLRHTCATLLLAGNVNPKIVSERLGHASVTITSDTYQHVLPSMQSGAAGVLAGVIG